MTNLTHRSESTGSKRANRVPDTIFATKGQAQIEKAPYKGA
jgi:hypothetical protein